MDGRTWPRGHGVAPNSADLNPIENIWGIMKRRLELLDPSKADFDAKINEVWESLEMEFLERLIASMPTRMQMCIENEGGAIPY